MALEMAVAMAIAMAMALEMAVAMALALAMAMAMAMALALAMAKAMAVAMALAMAKAMALEMAVAMALAMAMAVANEKLRGGRFKRFLNSSYRASRKAKAAPVSLPKRARPIRQARQKIMKRLYKLSTADSSATHGFPTVPRSK